jgi:hypothetical protein
MGLGGSHFQCGNEILPPFDFPHPLSPAARFGFYQEWKTEFFRLRQSRRLIFGKQINPRHSWDARFLRQPPGLHFIPQLAYCFCLWADENQTGFFDLPGKSRIFGKQAVAGVNRFRPAFFGCFDDSFRNQIGFFDRRRADGICLVRQPDSQ